MVRTCVIAHLHSVRSAAAVIAYAVVALALAVFGYPSRGKKPPNPDPKP